MFPIIVNFIGVISTGRAFVHFSFKFAVNMDSAINFFNVFN